MRCNLSEIEDMSANVTRGIGNVLVNTKSKWGIHFMQVAPTGWGFRFQQEHSLDD